MRRLALLLLAALACDAAPDPDRALFRRAYDLSVAGRDEEALAVYRTILRTDGGSRYQPEAHVALAEWHFKRGEFDAALEHYRAVEAVPGAPTRPYAIYKQGWCYVNKGDAARAAEIFERVVAMERDDGIPERQRKPLVEAARKDLVTTYASTGAPEKAAEYFQTLGGDTAALLERLSDVYAEKGQWERSTAVLRELIAAQVESPRLCTWQGGIVRAALAGGSRNDQLAEIQRLGAVLARLEGGKGAPREIVEDCRKRLRETSKELALLWHKKAQASKDPALYQLSDPLYRQYLTRFGGEQDGYDMTFFHAEVLWQLERWADASDEYRRVVQMNPAGKHTKEAAYASMLAAKNALEAEGTKLEQAAAGKPPFTPRPLTTGDRRLLDAFDLYVSSVPSSPELAAIEYRRARLLYDRDHLAEAAPLFWRVVERHPDSELAVYAGNLYLDALNALGRKEEVCAAARRLVAGPVAARDPQFQRELRRLVGDCARLEAKAATRP
ncbi:MAG TPA: tetratricopeptide repeat protein [Polyangia bacterium]|nr:tetratricopeptide repeat protein [Polyangia bacterium]